MQTKRYAKSQFMNDKCKRSGMSIHALKRYVYILYMEVIICFELLIGLPSSATHT